MKKFLSGKLHFRLNLKIMNNFKKILLFLHLFFVTKHEILAHSVVPAVNLSSPALAKGWGFFLLEHAGEALVYGGIVVGAVYLAKQALKQQQSHRPNPSVFGHGNGKPFDDQKWKVIPNQPYFLCHSQHLPLSSHNFALSVARGA